MLIVYAKKSSLYKNIMRLWSIHPQYLDAKGLVACWREGLLAKKVLSGHTIGYRNHPQLLRFKAVADPIAAIDGYLYYLLLEANERGYHFDGSKISTSDILEHIPVTSGQLIYEFNHLKSKLSIRDLERLDVLFAVERIEQHPLFYVTPGEVEPWEKV
ncbi:MAG: pyrimidine dimer DNA glycosylase/endonuclease V [Marinifilaceae bacterium]